MSEAATAGSDQRNFLDARRAFLSQRLGEALGEGPLRALLDLHADPKKLDAHLDVHPNRNGLVRALLAADQALPEDVATQRTKPVRIPRHIVQFWHSDSPPDDVMALIRSWVGKNPDYRHTLFNDRTARAFIATEYGADMGALFDACTHPVLRCDLFRYLYLYRKGGIYIDADDECIAPLGVAFSAGFDLMFAGRAWLFAESREILPVEALRQGLQIDQCGYYINNAPIAAVPGQPVFERILMSAVAAIRADIAAGRTPQIVGATAPQNFMLAVLRSTLGAADPLAQMAKTRWIADWYGGRAVEKFPRYKKTDANWRQLETMDAQPKQPPGSRFTVFRDIFRHHRWGAGSGPGSTPSVTGEYRLFIERFIALNNIRTVLDIGCGDWQFSRFINFAPASYLGLDVVPELVEANRKRFGSEHVAFEQMPETMGDAPAADLVLIKDVLQHLPNAVIEEFRREVLPKCRFALITNSFVKGNTARNTDIDMGGFRCLDLLAAPYNFPGAYVLDMQGTGERLRTLLTQGGATA